MRKIEEWTMDAEGTQQKRFGLIRAYVSNAWLLLDDTGGHDLRDLWQWSVIWRDLNNEEQFLRGMTEYEEESIRIAEWIMAAVAERDSTLWPPDNAEEDAHD